MLISRDIVFHERIFPLGPIVSEKFIYPSVDMFELQEESTPSIDDQEDIHISDIDTMEHILSLQMQCRIQILSVKIQHLILMLH